MKSGISYPSGNASSLVPEVKITSGLNIASEVIPCKHGNAPKIVQSTELQNNSFQDLKSTGRS